MRYWLHMSSVPKQVSNTLQSLITLTEAGIIRLQRPDRALRTAVSIIRWGVTPAAGYEASAARYPDEVALIDELGQLTFREIQERTNALAHALADDGVNEGDNVAIMARNHRGFVESVVACSKLGAHALFLNTSFSGPQLADVADREKPKAIVYDEEFAEVLADAGHRRKRYISWAEPEGETKDPTLEELIERGDTANVVPPAEPGKAIILTSGTTGTPKGASRSQPKSLDPVAALLSRIPLKAREKTMIAAPLFHAWGFAHFTLGMGLSSTIVLKRKFDEEATLSLTAQHGCTALVVVPVMLQRILELDDEILDRYDLSRVKAVPVSGSALPGLAERALDGPLRRQPLQPLRLDRGRVGDDRHPEGPARGARHRGQAAARHRREDLRRRRPARSTTGDTGRIFVGNDLQFEGYTGGGNKDVIDGLMSSGDVGHFDDAGRLFVDGRDDDMIVSGGENVFPQEVEELLEGHDNIKEAAVFGVDDEKFGQRLKAVVVSKQKMSADEVKKYVKANLAGYKVPRDVDFVKELPRTSTGKVLKRELKED